MLDNRLKMCAEMVSGRGIVCDVGTDHAYLAAELILSGKCEKVIASDVKEGPLEAAAKTVEKYGVANRVELILSDGLNNVPLDGVSDIIIAGMGGETIADIIGAIDVESCDFENIRWILQPMSKPEILREKLYGYQMKITSEKLIEDGDKLYVVMCAEYNKDFRYLSEFEAINGFFDDDDPLAEKYRIREAKRLTKVSGALEKAGKKYEAMHYKALACKLENGFKVYGIHEIYKYLDELYPFGTQESWDNSGLLVDNQEMKCDKVLLTLDITDGAVSEADCKAAQLIISHHPVIFSPLKRLTWDSPVYRLAERNIAAICMHTNLDIAKGGTNGVILKKLMEKFSLAGDPEPFEELGGENNLGWIIELDEKISVKDFGEALKEIFCCSYIRATKGLHSRVKRIAFCSGSGGSMLGLALAKKCDAYITGDVKHDVWVDSLNSGRITVFDCGHFHTENLVLWELRRVLEEKFPQLDVEISERSVDPVDYI